MNIFTSNVNSACILFDRERADEIAAAIYTLTGYRAKVMPYGEAFYVQAKFYRGEWVYFYSPPDQDKRTFDRSLAKAAASEAEGGD